jgi:DNA-directed RNA polymerase specialized sigma24 family protein
MDGAAHYKSNWALTPEAFDRLLAELDDNRESAGEKYERIRQKLIKFFKWRGCASPEEYADRTIDRVTRKIDEGVELRVTDPYLYFHGVALNVLMEHWREPERELAAFDDLKPWQAPSHDPHEERDRALQSAEEEHRLGCLERCIHELPSDHVNLISQYHEAEGSNKTRRKRLAESLGIPMNALRIRAYRIRSGLEACIEECLKSAG